MKRVNYRKEIMTGFNSKLVLSLFDDLSHIREVFHSDLERFIEASRKISSLNVVFVGSRNL